MYVGVCRLAPSLFLNQTAVRGRGNIFDIFDKKHVFWAKKRPCGNFNFLRPRCVFLLHKNAPAGTCHGLQKSIFSIKNVFCFKLDAKSVPEALATTIRILLMFSIVLAHRRNSGVWARPATSGTPYRDPVAQRTPDYVLVCPPVILSLIHISEPTRP